MVTGEVDLTAVNVVAPPSPAVRDDVIHVAVESVVKESELTLRWALHICRGRRICILLVHQPAKRIPCLGAKFSIDRVADYQVKAYHESERKDVQKALAKYMSICDRAGVHSEKLYIEMDPVEKGIVKLISQNGIRKLVMGGAANRSYSKRMTEPMSRKAIYVRLYAPTFCHIWFICKGHLIHTRESRRDFVNIEVTSPSVVATPSTATGQEENVDDDRLQQFEADAESSRQEAYEESIKRKKAEEEAIYAIRRAKTSETMYTEELSRREKIEEALSRGNEEIQKMKQQLDEINEDLRVAQEQISSLERQIAYSDRMVQELDQKISSAVGLQGTLEVQKEKGTGNAVWIAAAAFIFLGLPLAIVMDRALRHSDPDLPLQILLGNKPSVAPETLSFSSSGWWSLLCFFSIDLGLFYIESGHS